MKNVTELTRFDFHVNRFITSEAVEAMTAEEVGQYILLLIKAWMVGKEATLPIDDLYLSRAARVEKVSPLVMARFQKVDTEWGPRYRNKTLFEEWTAATQRSLKGSRAAAKRWHCQPNANALPEQRVANTQPVSTRINPTQPISKEYKHDIPFTGEERAEWLANKEKELEEDRAQSEKLAKNPMAAFGG